MRPNEIDASRMSSKVRLAMDTVAGYGQSQLVCEMGQDESGVKLAYSSVYGVLTVRSPHTSRRYNL